MEHDQSELRRAGLSYLSNTSQCLAEPQQSNREFYKTTSKYSHKKRDLLNYTTGFNSFQLTQGTIPIIGVKEAKNSPYINNLNVDSETVNKARAKNIEETYEERYRDIAIAETSTNRNDPRLYFTKDRQSEKGLFDEEHGFNIQRFLKRVAEEKLYGTFIQTLKNNDMQGQVLNTQRRMQYSLYSPQKSSSSFENTQAYHQIFSSQNVSPQTTQKIGFDTVYSKVDNSGNRSQASSRRPFSTNQRLQGEQLNSNAGTFYNMGDSQTTRDHFYKNSGSYSKNNKHKMNLTNRSFYGSNNNSFQQGENGGALRKYAGTIGLNSHREVATSHDERRQETPSGATTTNGIFVSAPMTSLLKRRQHHYHQSPNQNEYDNIEGNEKQMNDSLSLNRNNNIQINSHNYSTERKLPSALRNTYFISDYKSKMSANVSIENEEFGEEGNSKVGGGIHFLAKSLAASPQYRGGGGEEVPYPHFMNRQSSMKKSHNSSLANTMTSNMMPHNKVLKQNFSTLKKKNDFPQQKIISANEWKERSISQQFKIIQDEGSINKGNHQDHHHHIKVNHKDQGLAQVFRKISNSNESQQIVNIRTTRANFRTYLLKRYHEGLAEKLISFLEVPTKVDFMTYIRVIEKMLNLTPKQKVILCFILLDENEDGYICNSDMFSFLRKNQNKLTEIDIKNISRFAQNDLNDLVNYSSEDNELEKILIKKSNLTLTEYKLFKKKGVDCLIPTTVKKDTLYHASFQIIEHSNKYRQTVRQLEETKRNQLSDLRKNQHRVCKYVKDSSFCINFDQFEVHLSRMDHILYIYFDILAYCSLLQFSYIDYSNYDKNYYATFMNYKSEQVEFKSAYARLLKQHEENISELQTQNKMQKQQSPQINIDKVNLQEKAHLNRNITHKTTPMNVNRGKNSSDFNQNQN